MHLFTVQTHNLYSTPCRFYGVPIGENTWYIQVYLGWPFCTMDPPPKTSVLCIRWRPSTTLHIVLWHFHPCSPGSTALHLHSCMEHLFTQGQSPAPFLSTCPSHLSLFLLHFFIMGFTPILALKLCAWNFSSQWHATYPPGINYIAYILNPLDLDQPCLLQRYANWDRI
jgi:hypothetical protein